VFKWIGKLKRWRQKEVGAPIVHEYGRYVFKPIVLRALSVVLGQDQTVIITWVASPDIDIYLNNRLIQGEDWAKVRLESGGYKVEIPSQNKVWSFFIM